MDCCKAATGKGRGRRRKIAVDLTLRQLRYVADGGSDQLHPITSRLPRNHSLSRKTLRREKSKCTTDFYPTLDRSS
jgi:hypothetical protein